MHCKPLPTQDFLREWFSYEPATGFFRWKKEPNQKGGPRRMGRVAGTVRDDGYIYISVHGFGRLAAHRLAWVFVHGGNINDTEIDHADTNTSNNAIGNLRLATHSRQRQNTTIRSDNRCGLKGAQYHPHSKKWRSRITVDSRRILLGYFETPEDAHAAYVSAANEHFGEFARAA